MLVDLDEIYGPVFMATASALILALSWIWNKLHARRWSSYEKHQAARRAGHMLFVLGICVACLAVTANAGGYSYRNSFPSDTPVQKVDIQYFVAQTITTVGYGDFRYPMEKPLSRNPNFHETNSATMMVAIKLMYWGAFNWALVAGAVGMTMGLFLTYFTIPREAAEPV